jgi:hypothetical protein
MARAAAERPAQPIAQCIVYFFAPARSPHPRAPLLRLASRADRSEGGGASFASLAERPLRAHQQKLPRAMEAQCRSVAACQWPALLARRRAARPAAAAPARRRLAVVATYPEPETEKERSPIDIPQVRWREIGREAGATAAAASAWRRRRWARPPTGAPRYARLAASPLLKHSPTAPPLSLTLSPPLSPLTAALHHSAAAAAGVDHAPAEPPPRYLPRV